MFNVSLQKDPEQEFTLLPPITDNNTTYVMLLSSTHTLHTHTQAGKLARRGVCAVCPRPDASRKRHTLFMDINRLPYGSHVGLYNKKKKKTVSSLKRETN